MALTKRRSLFFLCLISFLKEALFLVLAPFFPDLMKKKNISSYYYAPIFICYSIFLLGACLIAGRFMSKVGRSLTMRVGTIMQVIATALFISLLWCDQVWTFCLIFFGGRAIEGCGSGFLQTAIFAEALSQNKQDQNKVVGILEFAAEFGAMGGLLMGAFFGHFFGYIGPFAAVGCLFTVFAIFQNQLISFQETNEDTSESTNLIRDRALSGKVPSIGYFTLFTSPRTLFGFFSAALCLSLWTFQDTTLEVKLEDDFDLKPDITSIIYSVQIMGFMPTSLLVHRFFDAYTAPTTTLVISLNFVVQGLATWCMGPSYLLRSILPNYLWITILGIFFTGVGGAFTSIGAFQEIYEPIADRYRDESGQLTVDEETLTDLLSGLYNAGQSIGCIAGPLFGSYIMLYLDSFRKTCDYFAIFTLSFAVLMFLIVYLPIKLKKKEKPKRKMTNQYLPVTSSGGDVERMRKRILSEELEGKLKQ